MAQLDSTSKSNGSSPRVGDYDHIQSKLYESTVAFDYHSIKNQDKENRSIRSVKPIDDDHHLLLPTASLVHGMYKRMDIEQEEERKSALKRAAEPVRISERLLVPTASNIHSQQALTESKEEDADSDDIWWQKRGSSKIDAVDSAPNPYENIPTRLMEPTIAYSSMKTPKYEKQGGFYESIPMPKPIDPESHLLKPTAAVERSNHIYEPQPIVQVSDASINGSVKSKFSNKNTESKLFEHTISYKNSLYKPKELLVAEEELKQEEEDAKRNEGRKVAFTSDSVLQPTAAMLNSKHLPREKYPDANIIPWKPTTKVTVSFTTTTTTATYDEEDKPSSGLKVSEPSARLLVPTAAQENARLAREATNNQPWYDKEKYTEVKIGEHLLEYTASMIHGRYQKPDNDVDPREITWKSHIIKAPKNIFALKDEPEAPFLSHTRKVVEPSPQLLTPTYATISASWRGISDTNVDNSNNNGNSSNNNNRDSSLDVPLSKKIAQMKPVSSNEHFLSPTASYAFSTYKRNVSPMKDVKNSSQDPNTNASASEVVDGLPVTSIVPKKVAEISATSSLLSPTAAVLHGKWKGSSTVTDTTAEAIAANDAQEQSKRLAQIKPVTMTERFLSPTAAAVFGTYQRYTSPVKFSRTKDVTENSIDLNRDNSRMQLRSLVSVKNLAKMFSGSASGNASVSVSGNSLKGLDDKSKNETRHIRCETCMVMGMAYCGNLSLHTTDDKISVSAPVVHNNISEFVLHNSADRRKGTPLGTKVFMNKDSNGNSSIISNRKIRDVSQRHPTPYRNKRVVNKSEDENNQNLDNSNNNNSNNNGNGNSNQRHSSSDRSSSIKNRKETPGPRPSWKKVISKENEQQTISFAPPTIVTMSNDIDFEAVVPVFIESTESNIVSYQKDHVSFDENVDINVNAGVNLDVNLNVNEVLTEISPDIAIDESDETNVAIEDQTVEVSTSIQINDVTDESMDATMEELVDVNVDTDVTMEESFDMSPSMDANVDMNVNVNVTENMTLTLSENVNTVDDVLTEEFTTNEIITTEVNMNRTYLTLEDTTSLSTTALVDESSMKVTEEINLEDDITVKTSIDVSQDTMIISDNHTITRESEQSSHSTLSNSMVISNSVFESTTGIQSELSMEESVNISENTRIVIDSVTIENSTDLESVDVNNVHSSSSLLYRETSVDHEFTRSSTEILDTKEEIFSMEPFSKPSVDMNMNPFDHSNNDDDNHNGIVSDTSQLSQSGPITLGTAMSSPRVDISDDSVIEDNLSDTDKIGIRSSSEDSMVLLEELPMERSDTPTSFNRPSIGRRDSTNFGVKEVPAWVDGEGKERRSSEILESKEFISVHNAIELLENEDTEGIDDSKEEEKGINPIE